MLTICFSIATAKKAVTSQTEQAIALRLATSIAEVSPSMKRKNTKNRKNRKNDEVVWRKTYADFVYLGCNYAECERRHGILAATIRARAIKEDWIGDRDRHRSPSSNERLSIILFSDLLLKELIKIFERAERDAERKAYEAGEEPDPDAPLFDLKQIRQMADIVEKVANISDRRQGDLSRALDELVKQEVLPDEVTLAVYESLKQNFEDGKESLRQAFQDGILATMEDDDDLDPE